MLISRLKLKLGAGTAAACDDYVNVKEAEDSFCFERLRFVRVRFLS